MSDLSENLRGLMALLREHPELLEDSGNRAEFRDFIVAVRSTLDRADSEALSRSLSEIEEKLAREE